MTTVLDRSVAQPVGPRLDASETRVRRFAVTALWLQGLYVLWACANGWYHNDDYVFRGQAARYGWFDPDYLFQPWGGHLMPGAFALAQLLAKPGHFSYGAIAVSLAAMQSLVAYLLYSTLRRHFGLRWRILALLTVYLVSVPVLQATVWWAAAVNALPYLACLVLMADRVLRWSTQPATRHLWWIVALQAVALAFFEKAVLGLLFVAMLTWTLSPAPGAWEAAKDVAARARVLWLALGVLMTGWAGLFLSNRTSDMAATPDAAVVSDQVWYGLVGTFLPSLLGGPWPWLGGSAVDGYSQVGTNWWAASITAVITLGCALWLAAWGVRARRALLTIGVYAVGLVVLINVGRQTYLVATSNLPRYYVDLVVVTVVCLAVASSRLRSDPAPELLRERPLPVPGRRGVLAGAVAVNLLLVANLWAGHSLVRGISAPPERAFIERSLADLRELGPGREVLEGTVPDEVLSPLGSPYNTYSWFYAGLPDSAQVVARARELLVIDEDGAVVPGQVLGPATLPGPDPCGYRVGQVRALPLSAKVVPWRHVLELDYFVASDAEVEIRLSEGDVERVALPADGHSVYLPISGGGVAVLVRSVHGDTPVCVSRVAVGVAAPAP